MLSAVSVVLIAGSVLGAGWTALSAARDRRVDNRLLVELIAVEALVLIQLVIAIVAIGRGVLVAGRAVALEHTGHHGRLSGRRGDDRADDADVGRVRWLTSR